MFNWLFEVFKDAAGMTKGFLSYLLAIFVGIIASAILLGLLGYGGYWVYQKFTSPAPHLRG